MEALAQLRSGSLPALTVELSLRSCSLSTLPHELSSLSSTLTHLDLSSNPITSLPSPSKFPYASFTSLKIIFFSDCNFSSFPAELALFPSLSMISFRGNGMKEIPEGALPDGLRWLILTNNEIEKLPGDIGRCGQLEKVMCAGNRLRTLPDSMRECNKLALLRISCNDIERIPDWLFEMPNLAFLAFSGNPCTTPSSSSTSPASETLCIPTSELTIGSILGQGASGIISNATYNSTPVAVKIFKSSTITSDGSPADEMAAALRAGRHSNLVSVLGQLVSSTGPPGIVLELVPPSYTVLGGSPSFSSCTRDIYPPSSARLSEVSARALLGGIAAAANHLHKVGVFHGDLYAHNILVDKEGHALLGDFGAATIYGRKHEKSGDIERLEVLAFGHLVEDVLGLLEVKEGRFLERLKVLHERCVGKVVVERPGFEEVVKALGEL
ncbi:hypothetical protein P7C70_g4381, partial [Phenoliferia sp. Uapishka_3]